MLEGLEREIRKDTAPDLAMDDGLDGGDIFGRKLAGCPDGFGRCVKIKVCCRTQDEDNE